MAAPRRAPYTAFWVAPRTGRPCPAGSRILVEANGSYGTVPIDHAEVCDRFGNRINVRKHPPPMQRPTRTKGYVILRRSHGRIDALSDVTALPHWNPMLACVFWGEAGRKHAENLLAQIQTGSGEFGEKVPDAFIARIHSKTCPVAVHIDQYSGGGNYTITPK